MGDGIPSIGCLLWYGKERRKPAGSYKWFEGNLFEVSDKAIEFIKEKLDLRIGGHTLGAQSDDTFEIDEKIVSEMINNGIAHRDYTSSATVQVELFRDRLTVFSPGPMHKDMNFEMLSEEHQSYATNPIIAHALYYVKYIEEVGSGTMDIQEICACTGLRPPVFEVDARHFNVTVYRPQFDENGNRIPDQSGVEGGVESSEVGGEYAKVGVESPKVGVESPEVGVESSEVGVEIDFDRLLAANRKTFRMTCRAVWLYLANHPQASQSEMAKALKVAVSTAQSACNALKEVGLLVREGATKNGRWIVNEVGKK